MSDVEKANAYLPAASLIAAHAAGPQGEDSDTTTVIAGAVCFLLGVLVGRGQAALAGALAIGVTALLYFKPEIEGFSAGLKRHEQVSVLQFLIVTFIVLPILPDRGYGPYGVLNPYIIWLMVVLTSGLSLAGYATLRLVQQASAVPLLGLLGGLVSSTATTLVFARQVRDDARRADTAFVVVTLANLVVLLRMVVLAGVLAPGVLPVLVPVLAAGLAAGAALPLRGWLAMRSSRAPAPDYGNPTSLRHALMFGAIFAVVLVVSAAFHAQAGEMGVYAVAAVSGLADMDANADGVVTREEWTGVREEFEIIDADPRRHSDIAARLQNRSALAPLPGNDHRARRRGGGLAAGQRSDGALGTRRDLGHSPQLPPLVPRQRHGSAQDLWRPRLAAPDRRHPRRGMIAAGLLGGSAPTRSIRRATPPACAACVPGRARSARPTSGRPSPVPSPDS